VLNKRQQTTPEAKPGRVQGLQRLSQTIFCLCGGCRGGLGTLAKDAESRRLARTAYRRSERFQGKGRPGKDRKPDVVSYCVEAGVASVLETRRSKIQQKSCFIIASNQLEESQLSTKSCLITIRRDNKKSNGLRF